MGRVNSKSRRVPRPLPWAASPSTEPELRARPATRIAAQRTDVPKRRPVVPDFLQRGLSYVPAMDSGPRKLHGVTSPKLDIEQTRSPAPQPKFGQMIDWVAARLFGPQGCVLQKVSSPALASRAIIANALRYSAKPSCNSVRPRARPTGYSGRNTAACAPTCRASRMQPSVSCRLWRIPVNARLKGTCRRRVLAAAITLANVPGPRITSWVSASAVEAQIQPGQAMSCQGGSQSFRDQQPVRRQAG